MLQFWSIFCLQQALFYGNFIYMKDILAQIKKRKWFLGVRPEKSLLCFSIKTLGEFENVAKYNAAFIDRLLIPSRQGMIRAFDIKKAKVFHEISARKIIKDPEILIDFIKSDNQILKNALQVKKLEDIIKLYKWHGHLFFVCFSLGKELFNNKNKIPKKLFEKANKVHNKWRNTVDFVENKVEKKLEYYLKKIAKKIKINWKNLLYLEISEIEKVLDKGLSKKMKDKIKKRKKSYIYAAIDGEFQVIESSKKIARIREYFESLALETRQIKGVVAYRKEKKIKGKVQIIKRFSKKIQIQKGNILVTVQTVPKMIPYLKNVKAIITDEGGITCHAAIVSRELNIPCIIGAKIATKVLKDGDEVEMDAEKGIVKIIQSA